MQALGRIHNADQAYSAVEEAALAFETFNLDLMYALPGQTIAQLDEDLNTALSLQPPHLSIYHLTIEPNTFFAKHPPADLPVQDLAYDMLDRITDKTKTLGMQRYEVSAYARLGHQCWHNTNYWQFGDYLGLGAGAHSKLSFAHRITRMVRHRDPKLYMEKAIGEGAVASFEEVSRNQLPFEFMLNALRLKEGFDLRWFTDRTGLPMSSVETSLQKAQNMGWIERDFQKIKPTERGFDFLSDLQTLFLSD